MIFAINDSLGAGLNSATATSLFHREGAKGKKQKEKQEKKGRKKMVNRNRNKTEFFIRV